MIYLLYNYLPGSRGVCAYQPVICLTSTGPMPMKVLWGVYQRNWKHAHQELVFSSLVDLQRFACLLLKKTGLKHCHLLSKDAYNEGVEQANDLGQLRKFFQQHAKLVVNDQQPLRRRAWGKLFPRL